MADFHISVEDVDFLIDAIATGQDPARDQLMELFGEISREVKAGRSILIAVEDKDG